MHDWSVKFIYEVVFHYYVDDLFYKISFDMLLMENL